MASTTVKLPAGLLPVVMIAFLLMTTPFYVTCYPVTTNLNVRSCPSTNCCIQQVLPTGTEVFIFCITNGTDFQGDIQWNRVGLISTGITLPGYVTNHLVNCGGGPCQGTTCPSIADCA